MELDLYSWNPSPVCLASSPEHFSRLNSNVHVYVCKHFKISISRQINFHSPFPFLHEPNRELGTVNTQLFWVLWVSVVSVNSQHTYEELLSLFQFADEKTELREIKRFTQLMLWSPEWILMVGGEPMFLITIMLYCPLATAFMFVVKGTAISGLNLFLLLEDSLTGLNRLSLQFSQWLQQEYPMEVFIPPTTASVLGIELRASCMLGYRLAYNEGL